MKSPPVNGISCCILFCHFQLLKLVNMTLLHIGQGSDCEEQKVVEIKEQLRLQSLPLREWKVLGQCSLLLVLILCFWTKLNKSWTPRWQRRPQQKLLKLLSLALKTDRKGSETTARMLPFRGLRRRDGCMEDVAETWRLHRGRSRLLVFASRGLLLNQTGCSGACCS